MKKVTAFLAAAIGIVVIVLGINLYSFSESFYWGHARSYDVSDVEFGGDYQTYIYEASNTMVDELNDVIRIADTMLDAQENMVNSMYKIGGTVVIAVGLAIFSFGLVSIGNASGTDAVIGTERAIQEQLTMLRSRSKEAPVPQAVPPAVHTQSSANAAPPASPSVTESAAAPVREPQKKQAAGDAAPGKTSGLQEHLHYALQYSTEDGMKRYLNGVLEKLSAAEQEELKLILATPQAKLRAAMNEYLNSKKEV